MSQKIVGYRMVYGNNVNELHFAVEKLIKEGWEPQGGVSMDFEGLTPDRYSSGRYELEHKNYIQAMIKRENIC